MNIKLSTIIISLACIATVSIISSCKINKELLDERKSWRFSEWKQDYKGRAFCLCILQGLNNKTIKDSILKYDKSFYNPLAYAIFDSSINIILKKEVTKMQSDSLKSMGRYPRDIASLLEGKRVFNHCTNFYSSKRLDSVVKIESKGWLKINDIMGKVHDKIPTF